ncbi:ABC transporter permease [Peptostreptococcaceae bacterium OttesenSCG-928-C18]|nr:ABC transporter permease [Peptostreptococcaceae bacterium OttesenSCG-928-C18]
MKFSVLFSDAFGAIKRNKKRSILTMLGIIIGIGAVIAIISIGQGFENYVVDSLTSEKSKEVSTIISFQANDYEIYNDENVEFFDGNDLRNIENIPGVSRVEMLEGSGLGDDAAVDLVSRDGSYNAGVKLAKSSNEKLTEGRNLNSIDNSNKERVIVISNEVGEKLFPNDKKYVGKSVEIKGLSYNIVGTFDFEFNMMGMNYDGHIPKKTYDFYNKSKAQSSNLTVYLKAGSSIKEVSEKITEYLTENGSLRNLGSYVYIDIAEQMEGISSVLDSITMFIALIGGISLFIAGIGMMNMMFISVSERTKEIGIRRALGATKKNITMQFLLEGIVITVIGGILGYFFGLLLAMIISVFLPFSVSIQAGPVFVALLISFIVGIVFSYSPAKAAANKNVIEILA